MNILMVCLGNICRSPMAEGILKAKLASAGLDWFVDSAGTSGWHIGENPDHRGTMLMRQKGIDISYQRSRQFQVEDFERFDLILAMDHENYENILDLAPDPKVESKVKLILDYIYPDEKRPVPDPYFDNRFEMVFELLDQACSALVEKNSGKSE